MQVFAGNKINVRIASMIFILAISSAKGNICKGDSVKGKYAINDSRNPDCPCHFLQRKAEQEYQKLLTKDLSNRTKQEKKKIIQPIKSDVLKPKKHYWKLVGIKKRKVIKLPRKNSLRVDLPCFAWMKTGS